MADPGNSGSHMTVQVTPELEEMFIAFMTWYQTRRTEQTAPQATGINSPPSGNVLDDDGENFRDSEIGYFDPDLSESYESDDPVTVGSETFFGDVFNFVDRIKDVAAYRTEETVRRRIPALLRGSACLWYTYGLSALEKESLRNLPGISRWCNMLVEHFRMPQHEAMVELSCVRCTMHDALERRPVMQYVNNVQRLARAAGLAAVESQLLYAYQGLDVFLRQTVEEPNASTTSAGFIRKLTDKRQGWVELARMERRCIDNCNTPVVGPSRSQGIPFRSKRSRRINPNAS